MSEDAQPATRKRTLRTVIVIGAVLVIEAVAIIGLPILIGGPAEVEATASLATVDTPEEEKIVELLVLDAKLPNNRSGVTYLYETEIYVQVKRKHEARVADELEQFRNEMRSEISAIWRTSDPRRFQEPKLENLTRKVYALLSGRFAADPQGEPIVTKCVIVMGTGMRVDL